MIQYQNSEGETMAQVAARLKRDCTHADGVVEATVISDEAAEFVLRDYDDEDYDRASDAAFEALLLMVDA